MFYSLIKILIRLTSKLFFRNIAFNNFNVTKTHGPLLLACNHPNSFLDAIIIGSHFKQPVHFLARGDAFRKPFARKILTALKLVPIYRLSEGREYLALNDATFERCREILLNDGIVLIFSEGLCMNQWHLRSLKKGTARIALDAWAQPAIANRFRVLPVSLNYNSFTCFGKRLLIHFGDPITRNDIITHVKEGESIHHFNNLLSERLACGLLQSKDNSAIIQLLISNHPALKKNRTTLISSLQEKQKQAQELMLQDEIKGLKQPYLLVNNSTSFILDCFILLILFIPAMIGWIFHAPIYLSIKNFVRKKTAGTVFYDSVMFGLLMLLYPLYWLIMNVISLLAIGNWYIKIIILLIPLLAWFYLIWKDCLQRVFNYLMLPKQGKKIIKEIFY